MLNLNIYLNPTPTEAHDSLNATLDRAKQKYPDHYREMAFELLYACDENNLNGHNAGIDDAECPACVLGTMCRVPALTEEDPTAARYQRMDAFERLKGNGGFALQAIEAYVLSVVPLSHDLESLQVLSNVGYWVEGWMRKDTAASK